MTLHAFVEYIKYRWKARGRHGTHSPFVYDFVEHILQDKGIIKKEYLITLPHLELKYENLLSRVAQQYNYTSVVTPPLANKQIAAAAIDLAILDDKDPAQWRHLFEQYLPFIGNTGAIAVTGIHKTPAHSNIWTILCAHHAVKTSLDMYGAGLLLFRQEFKEKQHFILKY